MAAANNESSAFLRAINEASLEQKSALIAETEQYREQRLAAARELAQKKYDEYILAGTASFASEAGVEAERRTSLLKKEVIETRAKITENVFSAVKERLESFTQTAEYENLLLSSAKKMAELCNGSPFVIFMREADMKFSEKIKAVSPEISIDTDNAIRIGGIYGVCAEKSIKLNDLLETRLEAQKEWFYENSGLSFNH